MRIFLIEQDVTNLHGEYLTEAMIIAPDAKTAASAVLSLRDSVKGWGLIVKRDRLKVHNFGRAPKPLPKVTARYTTRRVKILVIGTAADRD